MRAHNRSDSLEKQDQNPSIPTLPTTTPISTSTPKPTVITTSGSPTSVIVSRPGAQQPKPTNPATPNSTSTEFSTIIRHTKNLVENSHEDSHHTRLPSPKRQCREKSTPAASFISRMVIRTSVISPNPATPKKPPVAFTDFNDTMRNSNFSSRLSNIV